MIAREADTGKVRWVAKVSSEVLAAPTAADGVTSDNLGKAAALSAELWPKITAFLHETLGA